jgi:hypothetical protein
VRYVTGVNEVVPFVPPFVYNHMCSSSLLTRYLPVLIFSYCIQICFPIGISYVVSRFPYKALPWWIKLTQPGILWPTHWPLSECSFIPSPLSNHSIDTIAPTIQPSINPSIDDPASLSIQSLSQRLLKANKMVATYVEDVAILLTFGLCCPVLAFAIVVYLMLQTHFQKMLIGRFLRFRQDMSTKSFGVLTHDRAISALEISCQDSIIQVQRTVWIVVWTATMFYSGICWDVAGDEVGVVHALWAPLVAISFPLLCWIIFEYMPTFAVELRGSSGIVEPLRSTTVNEAENRGGGGSRNSDVQMLIRSPL